MSLEGLRAGVVLTGGGARGAYQIGAVRALSRAGIVCSAVTGVGAGALNGAVLAASPTLNVASQALEAMWRRTVLSPQSALRIGPIPVAHVGVYLTLLYAGGADPAFHEILRSGVRNAGRFRAARPVRDPSGSQDDGLFAVVELISSLLNISTDAELDGALSKGLAEVTARIDRPFYVSTYESGDGHLDKLKLILQGTRLIAPGAPTFLAVHELPEHERLAAVLASAALPLACSPHALGGQYFVDGSFGGLSSSTGAVPVRPLLHRDDVEVVIVVHTDFAAAFDATGYVGKPIFEIKPTVSGDAAEVGYFWADGDALARWAALGERDAETALARVADLLATVRANRKAHDDMKRAGDELDALP